MFCDPNLNKDMIDFQLLKNGGKDSNYVSNQSDYKFI